jgi:hypothetical protein
LIQLFQYFNHLGAQSHSSEDPAIHIDNFIKTKPNQLAKTVKNSEECTGDTYREHHI